MKKIFASAAAALMAVTMLAGCGKNGGSAADKERIKEYEFATVITVPAKAQPYRLDGFGCEWDPHFWRSPNTGGKKGVNEDDWKIITDRAAYLGMDRVRVWYMPLWFEKKNDNDDPSVIDWDKLNFESDDMKALIRELDFCEQTGIKVTLTIWGCELGSWLACKNNTDWVTAPSDKAEYAENISMMVQWIFNVKKYTCVDRLTLMNEPNLAWHVKGGEISFDDYVETCKAVDKRLRDDGVRDLIQLSLSDDSSTDPTWFTESTKQLAGIADVYAYHTYFFSDGSKTKDMYDFGKKRYDIMSENDSGHPVVIQEFGSDGNGKGGGTYWQGDVDDFERGLYYSVYAEQTVTAGVTGMLHWEFADVYYSVNNLMTLGLFAYKNTGWATRPFYYSWGMIMKYTDAGDAIYNTKMIEKDDFDGKIFNEPTGNISSVAFRSDDGRWTYLVTNRGYSSAQVQIFNEGEEVKGLKAHLYTKDNVESRMGTEDESLLIPADENALKENGHSVFINMPSHSFAVITNAE